MLLPPSDVLPRRGSGSLDIDLGARNQPETTRFLGVFAAFAELDHTRLRLDRNFRVILCPPMESSKGTLEQE